HRQFLGHVGLHQGEPRTVEQGGDVLRPAGAEVVDAGDGGARVQQGGAQMGADEARAAGDDGVFPVPRDDGAHGDRPSGGRWTGPGTQGVGPSTSARPLGTLGTVAWYEPVSDGT